MAKFSQVRGAVCGEGGERALCVAVARPIPVLQPFCLAPGATDVCSRALCLTLGGNAAPPPFRATVFHVSHFTSCLPTAAAGVGDGLWWLHGPHRLPAAHRCPHPQLEPPLGGPVQQGPRGLNINFKEGF